MKKLLITTGIVVLGVIGFFVAKPEPPFGGAVTEKSFLEKLAKQQKSTVEKSGKYARPKNLTSPFEYDITEYVSPKGPGYQVIFSRTVELEDKVETASKSGVFVPREAIQTKSVSYGPETEDRTWNWR